jgi:PH (Pleckstrin Homology) domain-containing protein
VTCAAFPATAYSIEPLVRCWFSPAPPLTKPRFAGETIEGVSETPQDPERPETEPPDPEQAQSGEHQSGEQGQAPEQGQSGEPDQASEQADAPAQSEAPKPLTFRITPVALLAVLAITICATPLATTSGPWGLLLYLIPVVLLVWILRTRTTVGPERVTVRTIFGGAKFGWQDVVSLRLDERRWLKAVLRSGKEVQLPAVRVRDLPRLAAISGGRLPDPTTQE